MLEQLETLYKEANIELATIRDSETLREWEIKYVGKKGAVTGMFAPASNRSLLLNVSGVDSNNDPYTGDMVLQLFEDLTSNTTTHIINSVTTNFYDGQAFGRVLQDFVVQEGDGFGNGGLSTNFDDEFVSNLTYTGFGRAPFAQKRRTLGRTNPLERLSRTCERC